jgi:DNA-binding NtrC family response regulator
MEKEINVLFVDDEENVLSAVKRVFFDKDYTVFTAASAADGLALLGANQLPPQSGIYVRVDKSRLQEYTI